VSSAKQKQQLHHHQLTKGSTTLKTFMFPEFLDLLRPQGAYARKKDGGKCQSGKLDHRNGRNDVLITYCTGDWLAIFGFVPACIDNCNLSYHGSAQQICTQGRNDIQGGLQALLKLSSGRHHGQ
jgi:hypothetical protein